MQLWEAAAGMKRQKAARKKEGSRSSRKNKMAAKLSGDRENRNRAGTDESG